MIFSGRLLSSVVVAGLYFSVHPALAFSPKILNSVVSVLPVWQKIGVNEKERLRRLEEPEGTAVD